MTFPAGTSLFFPVSLAGRDPTGVADPDVFEPERESRRHIAFGMGMHICLGQFIARAQIQEGLHLIAQRIASRAAPVVGLAPVLRRVGDAWPPDHV